MRNSFSSILTYSIQAIAILLIIFNILRRNEKKVGWGSLSPLLALLGMAVSFKFGNYIFGDQLLSFLGLPAWSNSVDNTRFHYTIFLSSIFFIPSLIIGYKNPKEFGAMIGKLISSIYLTLIIITLLFFIIS
ncbi:UNVERIFIED_CONTAM: preprotein translocase subunit SecG [Paenibacillus sp. PvR008]